MCTRIEVGHSSFSSMLSYPSARETSTPSHPNDNSSHQMTLLGYNEHSGSCAPYSHQYRPSSEFSSSKKADMVSPAQDSYQDYQKSSSDSTSLFTYTFSDDSQDKYCLREEGRHKGDKTYSSALTSLSQQYHSPPPYDPIEASNAAVDFAKFESTVHELTSNKIDIVAASGATDDSSPCLSMTSCARHQSIQKNAKIKNVEAKLEMKTLWDEFNELGTEMIVTKAGRFVSSCCSKHR